MWPAEPPPDAPTAAPTIYLAQKTPATPGPAARLKMGTCEYMTTESITLSPAIVASFVNPDFDHTEVTVRVLRPPQHGKLARASYSKEHYYYTPHLTTDNKGTTEYYTGKDTFVLEVSGGGVTVEVHYVVGVEVGQPPNYITESGERESSNGWDRYCPKGGRWIISSLPGRLADAALHNLVADCTNTGWDFVFADRPGAAVPQAIHRQN